jgi:hypothetical protein
MRLVSAGVTLSLLLLGCGPSGRDPGNGGGDGGTGSGSNGDNCSDAAKLVYVVDENNQLSQWDGATKTFKDLGILSCPAAEDIFGFPATPFSMAIDRSANAWVLYSSGELFKVNTTTLACEPTSWTTQLGLAQFGMGFSTDAVGGSTDTLFVAGGSGGPTVPTSTLARLDINTMSATTAGTVQGWPELTGTGNAELWGFFPNASGARIEKINKASGGSAGTTYNLAMLAGEPRAWAFAFWGGDFWVFLMRGSDQSTTVYQIDSMTGLPKGNTPAQGRTIVGAGVSTCAPTVIL